MIKSRRFLNLLAGHDDRMELDEAALEIVRLDHADVDVKGTLAQLDRWGAQLEARLSPSAGGSEFVAKANRLLFEELGFAGDEDDYFHPRNSCLDQVMMSRRGLPLTLAIVYLEIGRRVLRPVYGVALPGHFMVRYNDGLFAIYVDVFHQGRLMSEEQCVDLVRQMTQREPASDREMLFAPATKRQIVIRMLNNLRGAYLRRQQPEKVGPIDLLLNTFVPAGIPFNSL